MTKKTVLAIGIKSSFVDFSASPGLTAELVMPADMAAMQRRIKP